MEVRLLLGVLRAAAALVLTMALTGAVLGGLLGHSDSSTSAARTTILLDPDGGRPAGAPAFLGDPDRYVEGELTIIRSRATAARAVRLLEDATPAEVVGSVTATQQAGSSVVLITAEAASIDRAIAIADAVATAYIERRREGNAETRLAQIEEIDEEIASVTADLEAAQRRVAAGGTASDTVARDALLRRYDQLADTRATLAVATERNDRTAIIEPGIPIAAGGTGVVAFAALGFLVGGVLGAAIAIAWGLVVPRVLDPSQAEYLLGVPAVASVSIPRVTGGLETVPDGTVHALHRVAASVSSAASTDRRPRTVAVCAVSATGVSAVAAQALARAYAAERYRVAFLSIPEAEELVDIEEPERARAMVSGASAAGPVTLGDADPRLEHWSIEQRLAFLQVVRPRTTWAYPVDGERVEMLRRGLEPHADVIVVELPPLLESAVSASVAQQADAVVLVVPIPQQSEPELDLARQVVLDGLVPKLHLLIARRGRRG